MKYFAHGFWQFARLPLSHCHDRDRSLEFCVSSTFAVGVIKDDQVEPIAFHSPPVAGFFSTKMIRKDHSQISDIGSGSRDGKSLFRRRIDGGKLQFRGRLLFSLSFLRTIISLSLSCSFVLALLFLFLFPLLFLMFTRHSFDRERTEIPSTEPFYGRSPGGSKFRPGSPMYSRLNVFPSNKRCTRVKGENGRRKKGKRY